MALLFFLLLLILLASALIAGLYGFSAPLIQAGLVFLYVILGGSYIGWGTFALVLIAALTAEAIEFLSGFRGAQKSGGSKRGTWGAVLGGIVGAILGSPFFPIGPILGSFLGTYGGCVLLEISARKNFLKAHQVSYQAMIAKIAGFAFKTAVSVATIFAVGFLGALKIFSGLAN